MKLITGILRFIFLVFGLGILFGIAVVLLIGGTAVALIRGGRRPQFQVYKQWPVKPFQRREEKDVTPVREKDISPREISSSQNEVVIGHH